MNSLETHTSDRMTSNILQATLSGRAVANSVRNQEDANIETQKFCDWKCMYSSGICSCVNITMTLLTLDITNSVKEVDTHTKS